MRVIRTERLTLEPQTAAHADEMFAVLSDPAIYRHENQPPPSVGWLRERFERLESRRSPDGVEQWLNWVIRVPSGQPIGYVQATIRRDTSAAVAYELASAHWGRGLARCAVDAMIAELAAHYGVRHFTAVLKAANDRSQRLLARLGFTLAPAELRSRYLAEADELVMHRLADR